MGCFDVEIDEYLKKEEAARREQEAAKREQEPTWREREAVARVEKARQAFFTSPGGRARLAYEAGDLVFQYSIDVMSQQAFTIAMVGARTSQTTNDPVAIVNSVAREGWELVSGSFVFVQQGQESRDKFLASGQNVAVKGTTVGYYLFKRNEVLRCSPTKPWETAGDC